MASRIYAILSVALDRAVSAALELHLADARVASAHAAAVGASVVILAYAYADEGARLDSLAGSDLATPAWSANPAVSVAVGDSVGRAEARKVIAAAVSDRWDAIWTGSVPKDPGRWFSSANPPAPPVRPLWGNVRPWLMRTGDQFRPAPPPAFGSPAFLAAVAEVRRFSDARTQQQLAIARFWADGAGTYTPPGHWNAIAAELITWYNLSERDAAHVFALLNMAMMDAGIAVWDAKYTYWCIRPSQVDPAITTPVGLPNFPSYTSGHSGFSGAAADVLGYLFPLERTRLRSMADEAALSRVYAGIHFRFDSDLGLQQGRSVAALAIQRDQAEHGQTFYAVTH